MASKIYTKTGDLGKTSLIGGTKVPKSHIRIETYGTVDELNSYIGLVTDHVSDIHTKAVLKEIQDRLFTIGAILASDPGSKMKIPELHDADITFLEDAIDKIDAAIPPMKSFVLPGGHSTVSFCHISRCVCRRAERLIIELSHSEKINEKTNKQLITISVTDEKRFYIDKQETSYENLEKELLSKIDPAKEQTVVVRIPFNMQVQDLVDVLQIGVKNNLKFVLSTSPK